MTCRSCGTEIADKAIVCFRCGTPTADTSARPNLRVRRGPSWLAVSVLGGMLALSAWGIPHTLAGSWEHWLAWGGVVVTAPATLLALRRR